MYAPVTIITSTLNSGDELFVTEESIRSQTLQPEQWIVVDGGSAEQSLRIIRELKLDGVDIIWGPDKGIFDAWNKAISKSTGDWIIFLGAGDSFFNKFVLERISLALDSRFDFVYGNVRIADLDGRFIESRGEVFPNTWSEFRPATPHHQGVFHRKLSLVDLRFDVSYKVAGDQKLLTFFWLKGTYRYMNIDVSVARGKGLSMRTENLALMIYENRRISKELGITSPSLTKRIGDLRALIKLLIVVIFRKRAPIVLNFFRLLTNRRKLY